MNVPSWHPANQNADALRRLTMSGGATSTRTEFKEVNTSTEEERQMVAKEESAVLGGGRGLLDLSDRLYLVEQTLLEQQAKSQEMMERHTALQTFRSNALQIHAQKPTMPEISILAAKKAVLPLEKKAVVVIKAKKRKRTSSAGQTTNKKPKKPEKNQIMRQKCAEKTEIETRQAIEKEKRSSDVVRASIKPPATALLLEDYNSSSSSDDE